MRVDSIDVWRVAMPLISPFRTAFGDADAIESVLVRMGSGGIHGWGEATPCASPAYSPEWAGGAYQLVRDWLAPRILAKEIESAHALQRALAPFKGNYFAKAALDLAWWDLEARLAGKPLWRALGGISAAVDVGADFGVLDSIGALLAAIDEAVQSGFKRIKLKFRPGWELDMVRAVRSAFPETVIHVDCNGAYRLHDVELFRALDDFNLAMIEQPLAHDDLIDHARLQQEIRTPICLDESITSPRKAVQAIEIGACRWINIKPGRVGGITPALEILRTAQASGVPCWIGGMLESAIGASHCLALAALPNVQYPSDIFPSRRFYARDLGRPELELCGPSRMTSSSEPGIGRSPDERQLESLTLESDSLESV